MKAERTRWRGFGRRQAGRPVGAPGGLAAALFAASAALAATLFASDAWPKGPSKPPPPVAGVEVRAGNLGPGVYGPLRRGAEGEARRIAWKDVPGHERVVLSTSLVRLDTTRRPGGGRVNAVVSVSVFGVDRGEVKAVIEGSAEVRGENEGARRTALEAAARGAVRSVPAAMRLSRKGAKAPAR